MPVSNVSNAPLRSSFSLFFEHLLSLSPHAHVLANIPSPDFETPSSMLPSLRLAAHGDLDSVLLRSRDLSNAF
jgi:hypothetical protein